MCSLQQRCALVCGAAVRPSRVTQCSRRSGRLIVHRKGHQGAGKLSCLIESIKPRPNPNPNPNLHNPRRRRRLRLRLLGSHCAVASVRQAQNNNNAWCWGTTGLLDVQSPNVPTPRVARCCLPTVRCGRYILSANCSVRTVDQWPYSESGVLPKRRRTQQTALCLGRSRRRSSS